MSQRCRALAILATAVLLALVTSGRSAVAVEADRLDRFRQLAASRLAASQILDGDTALGDLWALLDDEVVESLASGGVFASLAFLQDRLDGLAEVWGGASLKLTRVGPLTVGAFHLSDSPGGSTVRVYGRARDEAQLLASFSRGGHPTIYPLPSGPGGAAQFLVVWEGPPSGRDTRPLRLDLMRHRNADVATVWSTSELTPEGLDARDWRVRGGEVRVRYVLRYPGWIPGCEHQTEQEDVLRLTADGATFTRVGRRQYDAWHLALRRAATALFDALAAGDRTALASLVPDAHVRERLPRSLQAEPACDAPDGPGPATVSVAASADGATPWALTWESTGGRWRLRSAAPVLQ